MALDVLDIDFSGTTDSSGNLTITKTPIPAYWCALEVVAQVAGNPVWIVQVNGRAVKFGRGPRADVGPILLQPKDQVAVQVTGALPAAAVTGKLVGTTASTVQEVLANFARIPSTISVDVSSSQQVLDHIIVPANGNSTPTLPVPPGTQAIGWQLDGGTSGPASVNITGNQSGDLLGSWATPFSGQTLFAVPIVPGVDSSVVVSVTALVAAAGGIYVIAWSAAPAPPLPVTVAAANGAQLTAVSEQLASPAPWQAPNLRPIRIGAGFPTTLATAQEVRAGVAGQSIYLFWLSLTWDSATAGSSLHLVDAPHGSPSSGTLVGDLSQVVTNPQPLGPLGPFTAGNSLYAYADAATVARGVWSLGQG